MSRNWQIFCYAAAALCFFLGFLGLELTVSNLKQRFFRPINFVALGLLFVTLVPLISTINSP